MESKTNDCVLRFANVNGSGSASANELLTKCLFKMGLHVGPKNIFPSNIQGFPTWYEIRVAPKKEQTGRRGDVDIMVAMNAQSMRKDIASLDGSGFLIYDSSSERKYNLPDGIQPIGLPCARLVREHFADNPKATLLQNIIYVGALAYWLEMDLAIIESLLNKQYRSRPKLLPLNLKALQLGFDFAKHSNVSLPFRMSRLPQNKQRILINGNEAAALACVFAGATVSSWYPITPSTSLMDAFTKYCIRLRAPSKSDEKNYAILQAEDEIAALAMVMGATWMGARSFTCTSGPGISLMTELLGYAYYAEIPAVIFNVQRCGPSTGMPTRNQQADLLSCALASHGDTSHLLLFPATVLECFEMSIQAFDLADIYQTPVIVMSELELAMNIFSSDPLSPPKDRWQRGKLLRAEGLAKQLPYYRYLDSDGDAIPYRTVAGDDPRGAYLCRGSGHDDHGRYTEDPIYYSENMTRLAKKHKNACKDLPTPVIHSTQQKTGVIYLGSSEETMREASLILAEQGNNIDTMRIRAFPFAPSVHQFIKDHSKCIVIDQNRDGQLRSLLSMECLGAKLRSLRYFDGMPLTAKKLVQDLEAEIAS